MKAKLESCVRTVVIVLLLFCAAWASEQGAATNAGAASAAARARVLGLVGIKEDYLTFGLNQFEFLREHTLFGEPLWKYAASLIYLLLAFYFSKVVDYVTGVWLKRLAARTETKLDDLLLELAHGPVNVVSFVLFLYLGLGIFQWPPTVQLVLSKAMILIVACSLTYMALKLVDALMGYWKQRAVKSEDKMFDDQLF